MPIRPADGVDVPVSQLFRHDDQRGTILDELARVCMAQAVEAERFR